MDSIQSTRGNKRELSNALDAVVKALSGKPPRKVISVKDRLVFKLHGPTDAEIAIVEASAAR